jgi:hypothetical protein
MPAVKDPGRSATKWARQSAAAQAEYETGVRNPKRDWATAAAEANARYKAGVVAANAQDRYLKGVQASGSANWQAQTLSKGPSRWAEGISLSQDRWSKGFAPYAQVIERTTLPARGPKGDASNIQRVAVIAKALHDAKTSTTR